MTNVGSFSHTHIMRHTTFSIPLLAPSHLDQRTIQRTILGWLVVVLMLPPEWLPPEWPPAWTS